MGTKTILIVDDESSLAKVLNLKLTAEGFNVVIALNGQDALDQAEKNHFDLILLDLVMPILDGFEVLEKLKQTGNSTPIIVASNLSQEEDINKVKELGALKFFVKSSTPLHVLVDNVKEVLNK